MKKLTKTQTTILKNAADRPDGNIEPLPSNINNGIKPRVLDGLLNRELIDFENGLYTINHSGFEAIGREQPTMSAKIETEHASSTNEQKVPRKGSKLATIVSLLQDKDGATLDELVEATDWKKHTIRGTISGSLKKRFKYNITSTKKEGELRRYAIVTNPIEVAE